MITWPKQPSDVIFDDHGFRQNHQAYIIKNLTKNPSKDSDKIQKWESALQNPSLFASEPSIKLKGLVRAGIPDSLRSKIWPKLITPIPGLPSYIETIKNGDFKFDKTIELDLTRTFPSNKHFKGEQSNLLGKLKDILNGLSIAFPSMGYCQGLNFIAAAILLKTNEETTYQILCYILHTRGHHLLLADVGSVRINLYILDKLFENEFKQFYNITKQNEVESMQYAASWFITLYCGNLPFQYCLRIIECYLLEGQKVLYRVAMAILKYKKRKAKSLGEFQRILMYLKDESEFDQIDPDQFFATAFNFSISKKEIDQYKKQYFEKQKILNP